MKTNYNKIKKVLSIIFYAFAINMVIVDPIIKWSRLEDSNPLSAWYFAMLLPLSTMLLYGAIFILIYWLIYGIICVVSWIFKIKDEK